jgi:hypothetical protein
LVIDHKDLNGQGTCRDEFWQRLEDRWG